MSIARNFKLFDKNNRLPYVGHLRKLSVSITVAAMAFAPVAYGSTDLRVGAEAGTGYLSPSALSPTNWVIPSGALGAAPRVSDFYQYFYTNNPMPATMSRSVNYNSGSLGLKADASATADVNAGKFSLFSSSDGVDTPKPTLLTVSSAAHVGFSDTLYFTIPNATASSATDIFFSLSSNGTLDASQLGVTGKSVFQTDFGLRQASGTNGYVNFASITDTCTKEGCTSQKGDGFGDGIDVSITPTSALLSGGSDSFLGKVTLRGDKGVVFFAFDANAGSSGGIADLSHTVQLSITAPDGVTWTSESGQLLTAVPEPETYAMLLVGLGLIGFMARRRSLPE
jgi:hypothetical protein